MVPITAAGKFLPGFSPIITGFSTILAKILYAMANCHPCYTGEAGTHTVLYKASSEHSNQSAALSQLHSLYCIFKAPMI